MKSPVAKLTPAPSPYCYACERRMRVIQAGTECDHVMDSHKCVEPRCPYFDVCQACIVLHTWLIEQDQALSV